ncbi:hypothetical protein B0H14DRAFT_2750393 [Mycena olivaceomarginata]|nr:hypothetical protein B0H14DRAFT_2750393 [Mycena olivaceomarginata]
MTRVVYGLVVQDGAVQNGAIKVKLTDTVEDVLDLTRQIGQDFPALPAQNAVVWLPSEFLASGPLGAEDLRVQLAERSLADIAQRATGNETIGSILDDDKGGVQEPRTHIVVEIQLLAARVPTVLEDEEVELEDLQGMLVKQYENVVASASKGKSPSVNAQSKSYNNYQGQKVPILDGRYNALKNRPTIAPPVELFHPVFACFRARLEEATAEVPEDIVRDTANLMRSSSAIQVSEQPRTQNTRTSLAKILKQSFLQVVNLDRTSADHIALCTDSAVHETAAVVIVEEKSELGAGGSEPSVQGSFSYLQFWADPTHQRIREGCCCPSFIVGLAGPWLVIVGAVFTSQIIAQRLTDYLWLGNSRVNDDGHVLRVARILHSLQASIEELQMYYLDLQPQRFDSKQPHPRFFPSITSYESNGEAVTFTYISPLESDPACMTFLAALDEMTNKKVVIKFVQRYGEEAHRLLARLRLAPELIHFGSISAPGLCYGGFQMAVMDYVEGQTLSDAYTDNPLPARVTEAISRGLEALHRADIVYGDLRRPNIMIRNEDQAIVFIDFDWAGKVGQVRYPLHLAAAVREASEALEYDLMDKGHDRNMF